MQDVLKLTGAFTCELRDEKGNLKDYREVKNVVVTVGKNYMAAWLAAASQAGPFMSYIGLGTGTTAAVVGDTNLEAPLASRVQGALTSSSAVWQNVALFGAGVNTGAVTEAGIFSESSGGTMMARQTFAVINKGANDSLTVTWQITIS